MNVYVVVHNLNREGPIAPDLLPILFALEPSMSPETGPEQ